MLVLTRGWRAIVAAIATAVALVVATGLMFGFDLARILSHGAAVLSAILTEGQAFSP